MSAKDAAARWKKKKSLVPDVRATPSPQPPTEGTVTPVGGGGGGGGGMWQSKFLSNVKKSFRLNALVE